MLVDFSIEVHRGQDPVLTAAIGPEGLSIGRDPSCGIVVADRTVSKVHAQLIPKDGQLLVTDLGSTAGTYVRGQRIEAALLSPGEEFAVGPCRFRVLRRDVNVVSSLAATVAELNALTALVGITDLQSLLETLLEQCRVVMNAHRGFVVLAENRNLLPILACQSQEPSADERFSRTLCQQALEEGKAVVLEGAELIGAVSAIESLGPEVPSMVMAIPLMATEAIGVLYLESKRAGPIPPRRNPELLVEISLTGGRALQAALDRQQILKDRERWRWLASVTAAQPDLFRSARSPAMQPVLELIRRGAGEDVTVLITGESGVGKEVAALTLHRRSRRSDQPFVDINCGAIPRELLEAELFGYEPGAFTGAQRQRIGRLELAVGGTLFFDEVGELPRDLQVKLLRALETRSFQRLGGNKSIHWDVRLIAATNRELEKAVAAGEFREDLYYRLNVLRVELPPLRHRVEDLEPLVHDILVACNRRFHRQLLGVTPAALKLLSLYEWPGNIRELRNVVERAFILENSNQLTPSSLILKSQPSQPLQVLPSPEDQDLDVEIQPLAAYLLEHEKFHVSRVLNRVAGNITQAARLLGMTRPSLHRRLRQLGLGPADDALDD